MLNKHLFPRIVASGTPYEIGLAHGKGAKKQIDCTISTYKSMFWDYSMIDWDIACKYAETFIPTINEYDPDYMEEIRGIADGSGYQLNEILALNVRSEIVLQGAQISAALTEGCTSFAFTPEVTECGNTLLGQNWDWRTSVMEGLIVLHIKQQGNKPDITMVTEAGIIGKIGFNSAGIGVSLNALASDQRVSGKVLPLHIALRGVLDSHTLSDAIAASVKINLSCCAHFMLASASGEAYSLELGPALNDGFYAEDGWLAHSNHFITPRMTNVHDIARLQAFDSPLRLGRIRKLIKNVLADHKVTIADIKSILTDHTGYPGSICHHDDLLAPAPTRMSTVFSIIMDLGREEMYLAPGTPCCCEYHLVRF